MSEGAVFGGIAAAIATGIAVLILWGLSVYSTEERECNAAGGVIVSTFSHYQPIVTMAGKVPIHTLMPIYDTECVPE